MPATSELLAAYVGTRPVTSIHRGTRPIAFGGGVSIPAGSSPPVYGSYGYRNDFENGLAGIGARVVGQSFLLLTMAYGGFIADGTPTGWSLPFDNWSPEVIGYGYNSNLVWAAAKVIVGADESNSGAYWEFADVSASWIRSYAIRWSDTQHEGIQVLYDGQDDFYSIGGAVPTQYPTSFDVTGLQSGATVTPGDQDIPANCASVFGVMATDNGTINGTGYTFVGRNSSTGIDSLEGIIYDLNTESPANRGPFTFGTTSGNVHLCTPRIVIPGAPVE